MEKLKVCALEREWMEGVKEVLDSEEYREYCEYVVEYLLNGVDGVKDSSSVAAGVAFYIMKPYFDIHRKNVIESGVGIKDEE